MSSPTQYVITIPRSHKEKDKKGKEFVVYDIVVCYGNYSWVIPARYSQLSDIHEKLKDKYGSQVPSGYPSKGLFASTDDLKFIESRRTQLEKYWQQILNHQELSKYELVKSFFGLDQASAALSQSGSVPQDVPQTGSFISPTVITLLPFRSDIPPVIVLPNSEECFVYSVFDVTNQSLQFFQNIEQQINLLSSKGRDNYQEQLHVLEENASKIATEVHNLKQQKTTFQQITTSGIDVTLVEYFFSCLQTVEKALDWQSKIENQILTKISSSPASVTIVDDYQTTNNNTKPTQSNITNNTNKSAPSSILPPWDDPKTPEQAQLVERILQYDKEVNDLLAKLTVASGKELEEIRKQLQVLQKKIEKDYNRCYEHPSMNLQSYTEALRNLYHFITDNNAGSLKSSSSKSPNERIEELEVLMYQYIEEANALDSKSDDGQSATKVRGNILSLMKQLATVKADIKKLEESKAMPPQEVAIHLNRIEDLQENLADFEHNFSTKFHFNRTFTDKTEDAYKSKKVDDAQKVHQKVFSDLFEL